MLFRSKLDSIITDFNKTHLNIVKRIGRKYYLNIPETDLPPLNASNSVKFDFWSEKLLNFPLYVEIIQSFSYGNSIDKVSSFTGVSRVSTMEIARWAEMVGDLKKIEKGHYKITHRSAEEILNRAAVCQLGYLGCAKILREKEMLDSGMRADVYGLDRRNEKEYYIESKSTALNLQKGINQVHAWISKNKNIEKWVLIPKETLKEVSFETLEKRYRHAKNLGIFIKVCDLSLSGKLKIANFKIPRPRDMKIFRIFLKILNKKDFVTLKDLKKRTNKKPKSIESFLERMIRFGLVQEKKPSKYIPTFKV